MKICVLQPDYSRSDIDYGNYDPSRNLTAILAPHEVHHVAINKLTTFRQLRDLSKQGFDLYVNLIEGYLDWDIPSIDVVHSLDRLGLPYTGPNAELYDPPKVLMKYIAHISGVKTSSVALAKAPGSWVPSAWLRVARLSCARAIHPSPRW